MAFVTQQFVNIWKGKAYVGARRPTTVVEVRGGSWRRDYRPWSNPINAIIPGETKLMPWYPIFTETTPWVTIPNVLTCDLSQDFEQNGLSVANIAIDNVGFEQATGPFGDIYHAISRGLMAPSRGYDPPGRPTSGLAVNTWRDVLTEQRNIRIWQGFGQPEREADGTVVASGGVNGAWVFNGLIDDVDLDSDPARIQVTARMGKTLTDSRMFGWNKSKQLKDPVIFSDRLEADNTQDVGENAEASSELSSTYEAANVLDDDGTTKTYWASQNHTTAGNTEWVEIRVPSGRYREIVLDCNADMQAFIGFYVRDFADGSQAMVDGSYVDEGWVTVGLGDVPGNYGGWPYIHLVQSTAGKRTVIDFGRSIVTGNDSIIRVAFRNLTEVSSGTYRARVRTLKGRRRERSEEAIERKWILVDDISDMVRVVLRWAGFTSWEVENTGTPLKGKALFNRATFLIDVIKRAVELTGFVFFVADPIDGNSVGVPVFRRNAALQRGSPAIEVRDTDLLTGLRTKRSEESLPYIIRVRGKTARAGTTLGGDTSKRIMAVYRPPWTEDNTLGGVIKHVVHTDNALRTLLECEIACYLIAINGCLRAFTATAEIPAAPFIELDHQVGLLDTATGLNTRLWVASRNSHFQSGERPAWETTLQGALIDTEDLVELIAEIDAVDFSPEPSPTLPRQENTPFRFRT